MYTFPLPDLTIPIRGNSSVIDENYERKDVVLELSTFPPLR